MKTEITTETKEFKPVTITVTFETKDELDYFICQMNAPDSKIIDSKPAKIKLSQKFKGCGYKFWTEIGEPLLKHSK